METIQMHTLAWNLCAREWNVIPVNVTITEGSGKFEPLCTDPQEMSERFVEIVQPLADLGARLGDKNIFVSLPVGYTNYEGADLAIALGIASLCGLIDREVLSDKVFVGELTPTGVIQAVPASCACFCVYSEGRKPYVAYETQCIEEGGYPVWASLLTLEQTINLLNAK